ncbi:protealysin inhibitor emfourin [Streptomyces sp. NPDC059851]|uniref:protealysin inhibitor emfourin n=1 Tax=Streptomyces sp. NPDC059851 TaxID=3346971 RepID=UPI003660CA34
MRIEVTRTGGIAGITRRAVLETTGRPDAAELERLARQVLAEAGPGTPPGVPDGYQYTVTVDGRTVEFADPDTSDALEELVGRVLKEGAR